MGATIMGMFEILTSHIEKGAFVNWMTDHASRVEKIRPLIEYGSPPTIRENEFKHEGNFCPTSLTMACVRSS